VGEITTSFSERCREKNPLLFSLHISFLSRRSLRGRSCKYFFFNLTNCEYFRKISITGPHQDFTKVGPTPPPPRGKKESYVKVGSCKKIFFEQCQTEGSLVTVGKGRNQNFSLDILHVAQRERKIHKNRSEQWIQFNFVLMFISFMTLMNWNTEIVCTSKFFFPIRCRKSGAGIAQFKKCPIIRGLRANSRAGLAGVPGAWTNAIFCSQFF